MILRVLSTGSVGNAYLLEAGGQVLLLDAGIPLQRIIKALDRPSAMVGCVVTHEHQDHCKSVVKLLERGIPVALSEGTWEAIKPEGTFLSPWRVKRESFCMGDFTVLPFGVQHDAEEPLGFLIRFEPTQETFLYVTDTYYLHYTFPGVNYWMIECNYCDETLDDQYHSETISLQMRGRLRKSHLSLNRLLDIIKANDMRSTSSMILCHLSDARSDEGKMVHDVQEALPEAHVYAAHAGDTYELNRTPF